MSLVEVAYGVETAAAETLLGEVVKTLGEEREEKMLDEFLVAACAVSSFDECCYK